MTRYPTGSPEIVQRLESDSQIAYDICCQAYDERWPQRDVRYWSLRCYELCDLLDEMRQQTRDIERLGA